MDKQSQLFLDQYLSTLPSEEAQRYTTFSSSYFCADEHNANVCADLVLRGEKRATCSNAYVYNQNLEPMPQVGELLVVTKWDGEPVCIVEITSVCKCKFGEVTAEFAAEEGEGDKTLESWRKSHWDFFSNECREFGIEPDVDMILVLERFKVVYQ
ncbi:MAG: ASCH domain-containing protein [Opitutales bacterium]|nr:ASCH domain-containing protein [Opitutales bacterium]